MLNRTKTIQIKKSNSKIVYYASFLQSFGHTYIHSGTIPYTQNASLPSPTESQWGSLKFPGQPDKYDYFQIQEYQRVKYCTHNSEAFTMELLALIPWGKMTNMCVSELGVHWLKQWLVACLAQVHYLYRHFCLEYISKTNFILMWIFFA